MLNDELNRQVYLLRLVAQEAGLDETAVLSWEYLETINYETPTYDIDLARSLDFEKLHILLQQFAVPVACYFALHEDDLDENEDEIVLNIYRDGHNQYEVDRFRDRVLPCEELIFVFSLEKESLLRLYHLEADYCHFFLFLFAEALIDYFGRPHQWNSARSTQDFLPDLEHDLWPEQRKKKIIILTQALNLYLDGPYLGFAGGELLEQWPGLCVEQAPDLKHLTTLYDEGRTLVKWDYKWVKRLTPFHLELHAGTNHEQLASKGTKVLCALLQQHLLNLSILFTANHTIQKKREWVAIYWDAENRVEIPSTPPADAVLPAASLAHADGLLQAVRWVYVSEWPQDRIYFLQSSVTQEIRLRPTINSNQVLLDEINAIHTSMDRRLAQFVREKEQAFSAEERALQDFSAATADAFSHQTSEIIKTVSDTMLAAIAALLGSFIAAGFDKNSFDARIFTVGMVVYSAYVLFFPLLYNMSNQWARFQALKQDVDAGYGRFSDKLGEERAQELAGKRIQSSKKRFRFWFWLTIGVYVAVVIIGLVAAFWVPQLVK